MWKPKEGCPEGHPPFLSEGLRLLELAGFGLLDHVLVRVDVHLDAAVLRAAFGGAVVSDGIIVGVAFSDDALEWLLNAQEDVPPFPPSEMQTPAAEVFGTNE